MNFVKVHKTELLETLKKNKEGHRELFLAAQEGWKKRIIEELDRRLADARAGRKIRALFSVPEPEDHTKDYNRIIRMVEMSVENVLELTAQEFQQYVMDDWSWKAAWSSSNVAYVNASSSPDLARTMDGEGYA